MRKTLLMAFGLILAALLSTSSISPASAQDILSIDWLPPYVIKGYEPYDIRFHDMAIVAYTEGSTASLNVRVENDIWPYNVLMNVSAVKIGFDWNINYSSGEVSVTNPVQLSPWETHTFKISFTVPNTTVASNMWAHTYTVYVEWVNATGGLVGSRGEDWNYVSAYTFAVYSADQKSAGDLYYEIDYLIDYYPPYYFDSINARLIATQAGPEASRGYVLCKRGEFSEAKTKFQTALDLYDQAFTIEGDWGTTYQDAQLNKTINEANAYLLEAEAAKKAADAAMITANATTTQSYAWLLFGVAAVLLGIAAVVYAIKKPKI